jgi:hypothetical protein
MHMEYMGLGEMWDYVLDKYIFPLVSGVYLGYNDVSDFEEIRQSKLN